MEELEFIGKKIVKGDTSKAPDITINPINGDIKFSKKCMKDKNLLDEFIGFAYGKSSKNAYLFVIAKNEEGKADGVKIASTGRASSRFHARALRDLYSDDTDNQFTFNIGALSAVVEDKTIYPLEFIEIVKAKEVDKVPESVVEKFEI